MAPDRERDAATTDDAALVRYQAKWDKALARLQRAHPARWSVRGWSTEEVRDALTLRLLEVVRGDRAAHVLYEREGKDWALVVMCARLAELRKAHRLDERPMDFDDAPFVPREPNQEQQWLDAEADACRALARGRAERALTRPQRRWFAAMRMAANAGAFFRASDELNLSAASRVLGKNRSSAQRAWSELQLAFARELERVR
jgi:hypothetical protein